MGAPPQIGNKKRPREQFGKLRFVKLRIEIAKALLQFFRRQAVFDLGNKRRKQGGSGVGKGIVGLHGVDRILIRIPA